jgi:hypothetical protein
MSVVRIEHEFGLVEEVDDHDGGAEEGRAVLSFVLSSLITMPTNG